MNGTGKGTDDWLYEFYCPRPQRSKPVRFVRDKSWKLYGDGRFFNIPNDVLEQNPLSGPFSPEGKAAHKKLSAALKTFPTKGQSLLKFVK